MIESVPGFKTKKGKILTGVVVSDKMDKTMVVEVRRFVKHRKYGKYLIKRRRFLAHDESGQYRVGDKVIIRESRPLSRRKHFVVVGSAAQ